MEEGYMIRRREKKCESDILMGETRGRLELQAAINVQVKSVGKGLGV